MVHGSWPGACPGPRAMSHETLTVHNRLINDCLIDLIGRLLINRLIDYYGFRVVVLPRQYKELLPRGCSGQKRRTSTDHLAATGLGPLFERRLRISWIHAWNIESTLDKTREKTISIESNRDMANVFFANVAVEYYFTWF